jgi:predicted dinucleotide-binding enzyme
MTLPDHPTVVPLLGGTGEQGRGPARRFALAGHEVVIGSRDAARAEVVARDLPGHVTAPRSWTST